ncbi:hypothetical protein LSCM4_00773 [Leishmania orientalis]|uniref:Uncharacterized protein n=1 Tax=Leishmania orientalis TaxID=2249476 RepID=A0A836GZN2_9TRYP|nr:hypothetical protein LSCM4_00773 [Leishmania orientalis]
MCSSGACASEPRTREGSEGVLCAARALRIPRGLGLHEQRALGSYGGAVKGAKRSECKLRLLARVATRRAR